MLKYWSNLTGFENSQTSSVQDSQSPQTSSVQDSEDNISQSSMEPTETPKTGETDG